MRQLVASTSDRTLEICFSFSAGHTRPPAAAIPAAGALAALEPQYSPPAVHVGGAAVGHSGEGMGVQKAMRCVPCASPVPRTACHKAHAHHARAALRPLQ
jgi:hypothetical protein